GSVHSNSLTSEWNIICGNMVGISIFGSKGNTIIGNYIGVGSSGNSTNLGNSSDGIRIEDSPNTTLGIAKKGLGLLGPAANIISGNVGNGVSIYGACGGTTVQGN